MNDACRDFRTECASGADAVGEHPGACPACAQWLRDFQRRSRALSELTRLSAPAELEAGVAQELAGERTYRLQRALATLARLGAPARLDESVLGSFARDPAGDEERGKRKAQAVRALEFHSAPNVLERLVNEELAAPERHVAERFTGNLERLGAPRALADGLRTSVRRRTLVRLVLGPVAALTAAGVVVWLAIGREPEPRRRRFDVVYATSLEEMVPLARALAESLGGRVPQ